MNTPRNKTATITQRLRHLEEASSKIFYLTQKLDSISLNAATEAARSQLHSENFTLVADQLGLQVNYLENFSERMRQNQEKVDGAYQDAVGARVADFSHLVSIKWAEKFKTIQEKISVISEGLLPPSYTEDEFHHFATKVGQQFEEIDTIIYLEKGTSLYSAGDYAQKIEDCPLQISARQMRIASATGSISIPEPSDKIKDQIYLIYELSESSHMIFTVKFVDENFTRYMKRDLLSYIAFTDELGNSLLANNNNTWFDNLSWLRPFQEFTLGRTGYSREYSKNGWASTIGFYPMNQDINTISVISCLYQNDSHRGDLAYTYDSRVTFHFPEKNKEFRDLTSDISVAAEDLRVITNETGMLSVNAAIQAGMAGGEGKSFSVVADQIGRISQEIEHYSNVYKGIFTDIGRLSEDLCAEFRAEISNALSQIAVEEIKRKYRNCKDHFNSSSYTNLPEWVHGVYQHSKQTFTTLYQTDTRVSEKKIIGIKFPTTTMHTAHQGSIAFDPALLGISRDLVCLRFSLSEGNETLHQVWIISLDAFWEMVEQTIETGSEFHVSIKTSDNTEDITEDNLETTQFKLEIDGIIIPINGKIDVSQKKEEVLSGNKTTANTPETDDSQHHDTHVRDPVVA